MNTMVCIHALPGSSVRVLVRDLVVTYIMFLSCSVMFIMSEPLHMPLHLMECTLWLAMFF